MLAANGFLRSLILSFYVINNSKKGNFERATARSYFQHVFQECHLKKALSFERSDGTITNSPLCILAFEGNDVYGYILIFALDEALDRGLKFMARAGT